MEESQQVKTKRRFPLNLYNKLEQRLKINPMKHWRIPRKRQPYKRRKPKRQRLSNALSAGRW